MLPNLVLTQIQRIVYERGNMAHRVLLGLLPWHTKKNSKIEAILIVHTELYQENRQQFKEY